MPGIKGRVERLEEKAGRLVDDRDPGMIELCEIIARSEGRPFDIEDVPRNFTVVQLLKLIDGKSRGLPSRSCGADVIKRRREQVEGNDG